MHNALCNSLKATGQVKRAVVDTQGETDSTEHTSGECTYVLIRSTCVLFICHITIYAYMDGF